MDIKTEQSFPVETADEPSRIVDFPNKNEFHRTESYCMHENLKHLLEPEAGCATGEAIKLKMRVIEANAAQIRCACTFVEVCRCGRFDVGEPS